MMTLQASTAFALQWLEDHFQWQPNYNGSTSGDGLLLGEDQASFVAQVENRQQGLAQLGVCKVIGMSASRGQGLQVMIDSLEEQIASATADLHQSEGYMITRYSSPVSFLSNPPI